VSRRGDRDDDERRRGAKQRTTPHTRYRGEPEREAVPQLDPRACRRDGGKEGDDDERWRGAMLRWSEPNAGDEGVGYTPRVLMQGRRKSRRWTPTRIPLYSY
jgi:hypothetical protein